MRKAIALVVLILAASAVFGQEISQSDLYGMWEYEDYEDFPSCYFINATTLTFITNFDYKQWSDNILSWRLFINENVDTKFDYPYGFDIVVRSTFDQFIFIRTYLVHRDKRKMFWTSLPDVIYIKK
ncbi:MAG: hypothetical protein FWB73_00395 [Treponema sp.]|nr:hypothetical protein [Treponema sp.]